MKSYFISAFILLTLFYNIHSQTNGSKYGNDSLKCLQSLSSMQEFVKIKVYSYAYDSWLYTYENCPAASKNIYIYGTRIIKDFIENGPESRKSGMIDTLMLVYDKRIEIFGQKGYVLGRKGIDLAKYDKNREKEAYAFMKESIQLEKTKTEAPVFLAFMMTTINLVNANEISCEEVINNFSLIDDYISKSIDKSNNNESLVQAKNNIEEIFANSECSSCENLVALYEPKFEKNIENIDFLKSSTAILSKKSCENTPFYAIASEQLYSLEPSAMSAYNLTKLFLSLKNYAKASDYLLKAIELEVEPESKALYYYQLSVIKMSEEKDYPKAVEYAFKAAELKPDWGEPYILIGNAYAASSKNIGQNPFEQNAVFWAAVDMFIKAKNVDSTVTEKANELIGKYSIYYPSQEDIFFYGYRIGETYEVKGWINEKTQIRVN
ncbi:MAG: hypothetical protein JXB17_02325 [Bacteroidales bacterium]|nr:hypothetical protein [Bacteroidales bacterium]